MRDLCWLPVDFPFYSTSVSRVSNSSLSENNIIPYFPNSRNLIFRLIKGELGQKIESVKLPGRKYEAVKAKVQRCNNEARRCKSKWAIWISFSRYYTFVLNLPSLFSRQTDLYRYRQQTTNEKKSSFERTARNSN